MQAVPRPAVTSGGAIPLGRFAWRLRLVFHGLTLLLKSGLLSALLVLWLVLAALVFDDALVFLHAG